MSRSLELDDGAPLGRHVLDEVTSVLDQLIDLAVHARGPTAANAVQLLRAREACLRFAFVVATALGDGVEHTDTAKRTAAELVAALAAVNGGAA